MSDHNIRPSSTPINPDDFYRDLIEIQCKTAVHEEKLKNLDLYELSYIKVKVEQHESDIEELKKYKNQLQHKINSAMVVCIGFLSLLLLWLILEHPEWLIGSLKKLLHFE